MRFFYLLLLVFLAVSYVLPAQAPCDTIQNCCSARCGDSEPCLCDCFFAAGQALRLEERYADAVKRFEVVAQMCPDDPRHPRAVIDSIYREHRIWVYQEGKFAIATPLGEPLTTYWFSNPEPFHKGVAWYEENGKHFFVDKDGKVLTPLPGLDAIIPAEGGLFYLKDEGSHSVTDEKGLTPRNEKYQYASQSVFSPAQLCPWSGIDSLRLFIDLSRKYDYVGEFKSGWAWVRKGEKWGVVDKQFREVCPVELSLERIGDFSENRAVIEKNDKAYLMDPYGKIISEKGYDFVLDVINGLARVNVGGSLNNSGDIFDGTWGVIDQNGKELLPPVYYSIGNLNSNFIWAYYYNNGDNKWTLLNKNFQKRFSIDCNQAFDFHQNIAWMNKQGRWILIDTLGIEITRLDTIYDDLFVTNKGGVLAKSNGLWGLLDAFGNTIVPPKFQIERLYFANEDYFWINQGGVVEAAGKKPKGGKWGILSADGRIIREPVYDYDDMGWFENGLTWVEKNGLKGIVDSTGLEIVAPQYNWIGGFHEGLARFLKDSLWGFIDRNGKETIPAKFYNKNNEELPVQLLGAYMVKPQNTPVGIFQSGLAWVSLEKGKTFLERNGHTSLRLYPNYSEGWQNDGFYWVRNKGNWGVLDGSLNEVFEPQFNFASEFIQGKAICKINEYYGLIDTSGHFVLPTLYKSLNRLTPNRFWVEDEFGWHLLNGTGQSVTDTLYEGLSDGYRDFSLRGNTLNKWALKNNLWGLLDTNAQVIIPFQYESVGPVAENRVWVKKNGVKMLIDLSGNLIPTPELYDRCWPFQYGLSKVEKEGLTGVLDTNGQVALSLIYEDVNVQSTNLAIVKKNGKYGMVNRSGELITPIDYEYINEFKGDLALAEKGDKYGIIDTTGKEVISFECDMAQIIDSNWLLIIRNGRKFLINRKSREIQIDYENISYISRRKAMVYENGNWGVVDLNKQIIIPIEYQNLKFDFEWNAIWVNNNDIWGIVDTLGNEIMPPRYSVLRRMPDGLIYGNKGGYEDHYGDVSGGKWGFSDTTGRELVPSFLDEASPSFFGTYLLHRSGKKGLLFSKEGAYIPPEYDEIALPLSDWVIVLKNNKWGWVDHHGNLKIPCRFDAVTPFNEQGRATVLQAGLQFQINKKGEMIWPR